jgi:hypothetical protein
MTPFGSKLNNDTRFNALKQETVYPCNFLGEEVLSDNISTLFHWVNSFI